MNVAPVNETRDHTVVRRDHSALYRRPSIDYGLVDLFRLGDVATKRPGLPPMKAPPALVVAIKSGGGMHVLDGHHRVLRFRREGYTHAWAWILDYTGDNRFVRRTRERPVRS